MKGGVSLANGGKISGATSSALTITTVTQDDEASYSVVVTNAAGSVTSSNAALTVAYPLPYHDQFNYTAGSLLGGQTNDDWLTWSDVGTSTAGPYITNVAGNLTVTGLATSTGNSIKFGGLGKSARFSFASGTAITNGTLYYSFALKATNLTGLDTNGTFVAGFNNSIGTQTAQPTVVGTRIYLRKSGSGYNIGLSKNSSTTTDWVWNSTVYTSNQTVFLVGSYAFTTAGNSTDDISKLWINPATNTFGGTAPAATLTASSGTDITANQILSFVFLQRSSTAPAAMIADELRIARTWAEVTPPTGSQRGIFGSPQFTLWEVSGNQLSLSIAVIPEANYAIESSNDLLEWTQVTTFVATANEFTFTEAIENAHRFYRIVRK